MKMDKKIAIPVAWMRQLAAFFLFCACVGILVRYPNRYDVKPFESKIEALAIVLLESERLRGELI